MPILDDSGIESEDKLSSVFDDVQMAPQKSRVPAEDSTAQHMADLEVAFRRAGSSTANSRSRSFGATPKIVNAPTTDSDGDGDASADGGVITTQPPNTCRILQRKLELKVERAKRNYCQHLEESTKKSQSATLIPINRLPIPGDAEQKPLVDYKSDSSDEPEEISFFPNKLKSMKRQKKAELSDTFSIQEMTIDSDLDSDDSGSQNLELLPPAIKANVLDKLGKCFDCCNFS